MGCSKGIPQGFCQDLILLVFSFLDLKNMLVVFISKNRHLNFFKCFCILRFCAMEIAKGIVKSIRIHKKFFIISERHYFLLMFYCWIVLDVYSSFMKFLSICSVFVAWFPTALLIVFLNLSRL